jgi:superfamily II DNA or RNA helicase
MTPRFAYRVSPDWTEIRLEGAAGPIGPESWALEAPAALLAGVDLAQRLIAAGSAIEEGGALLVEHHAIAGLTAREAANLFLPPLTSLHAVVEGHGVIGQPGFRATLSWQRPNGQPAMGVERTGAWLRVGGEWQRLSAALFAIAEAIDRLAGTASDDMASRLAAIAGLREALPPAEQAGEATAKDLIGRITIVQADAFSLDLQGEGDDLCLVPVLHRSGGDSAEPLLPADKQRLFGEQRFPGFSTARPAYALGEGWFVVLSPPLRQALGEVRRIAAAPAATRRAFAASPRAFLRDALGAEADETVIEQVFLETPAWSERVVGLGVWSRRVLPWIPLPTTDWLGETERGARQETVEPPLTGIVVGERKIPLSKEENLALQDRIVDAIAAGRPHVGLDVGGERLEIPATHDTLAALQRAEAALARRDRAPAKPPDAPEVLLIKPNEERLDLEQDVSPPRAGPEPRLPASLKTAPKPHQREGIAWLQNAWRRGLPGVLLADDMGLGKTLQALAFLAWLREGMRAGIVAKAPLLVVAPTGLLENWRAEHDRHLASPGLGKLLAAYGQGLRALPRRDQNGRPALDAGALDEADWVLTTYETLRDYDTDFGRIRFAALLFDEAQKIKTPGTRITDAAKAMNAEFRIALTGTPVENRLADLWCIVDTVHPGCLGDLKSFSDRFERQPDTGTLKRLRRSLDSGTPRRPPLLLRRLKEDRLPELPACEIVLQRATMRGPQLGAYEEAIRAARGSARRGAVLDALQRLAAICLHPAPEATLDDEGFIEASARLRLAVEALDAIASRRERALVFVNDLDMQARLASLLQRRYRLSAPPMIINGSVDGRARQARVDAFQQQQGFDVMILSPRAGGVGLTLTAANHVIHLSRWWNPAVEDQCNGRVLRIGQTRPVTVHVPLAVLPGDRRSFDENLHALLERKRRLMREALLPAEPSEEEKKELLDETLGG